ncbi:hypothetical protein Ait01nite_027340 [Actinoplanes italicus]|nr:hypothetical protein [Actinoplanes italicus]GIE29689.1 hypothetical protein Ait01nite_027340 [Actinoplanes italicus]
MAQSNVSRRSPCRRCGGRYYVSTTHLAAALLATASGLGGLAKSVLTSGALELIRNDPAATGTVVPDSLDVSALAWAGLGMLAAIGVARLGGGYRCIICDTPR